MSEHPIQELMNTTMSNIRQMVDVNTIVGDPITTPDGAMVIPVSKVSFGFAAGGSDFPAKAPNSDKNFGGGSGAGITISPVAFLVVLGEQVRLIPVAERDGDPASKAIAAIPGAIEKIIELIRSKKEKNAD